MWRILCMLGPPTMSLYKRGNIWWSRIELDGVLYRFSTKTAHKNSARGIEAAWRTDMAKGRAGLTSPTLSNFATRFLNYLPGRVSKPTFTFYISHFKVLLDFPELADRPLDRIDSALIEEFVTWRKKQKGRGAETVTNTTVNHNLRTLNRALRLAQEWGVIARAPKVQLLTGENQREYVLSEETVRNFAEGKALIGKLVPFLVDTGLRRREVCELKWDAVNLDGKVITVTKGKTKHSRRKIPLTIRAAEILEELKKTATTPYVFVLRERDRITGTWASHAFLKVRRRLKLPEACVLHSTRHTFCTRLGEKGVDAFTIQRLAGHASVLISQRYVHPSTELSGAISLLD